MSTNLGLGTIRGGYCDLNVRFPHLHLGNKSVKTFLVSRRVSRDRLVSKHSCSRLVLKCWVNMHKPTCSSPQRVKDTAALGQSVSHQHIYTNSFSRRIICVRNQCSPVPLKTGFPWALAWPGRAFRFHWQLDPPGKSSPKQHAQINADLLENRNLLCKGIMFSEPEKTPGSLLSISKRLRLS